MPCLDTTAGCSFPPGQSAADWTSSAVESQTWGSLSGVASFSADSVFAFAAGASPSGQRAMTALRLGTLLLDGASEVTVTVPFTLTVDATGGDALHGSFAFASLDISGAGHTEYYISTPWDGTFTKSGVFTLTFSNSVAHAQLGLTALSYSRLDYDPIRPDVPAVPEPDTAALLLGGLAFVGFSLKRRRQSPNR